MSHLSISPALTPLNMVSQLSSDQSESFLEEVKVDDSIQVIEEDNGKKGDEDTRILREAASVLKEITGEWRILDEAVEATFPRFSESELLLGNVLGKGGFCVVNEVVSFSLRNKEEAAIDSDADTEDSSYCEFKYTTKKTKKVHRKKLKKWAESEPIQDFQPLVKDRDFIARRCVRNGDARYCVKVISDDTYKDRERYFEAVVDLIIEMKILSVLKHPNIIKIRGRANGNPYRRYNFILLDKLYETLNARIEFWAKKRKKWLFKLIGDKRKLFLDRIIVAHDLASAFKYLHENRIIYRDLKPENIGFDIRGDVKMFDFGLATELPQCAYYTDNTLYQLTGKTGSLRYMAPEVVNMKPYNAKADVYSFGILFWEMMSLKKPFSGYTVSSHQHDVIENGERPKINPKWPKEISLLVSTAWDTDIHRRPNFSEIFNSLREMINNSGNLSKSLHDFSSRTARSVKMNET